MTIVSNSDAPSASRDEENRTVDAIRQLGQLIVSTVRRVDKWWTDARLTRRSLHDLNLVAEAERGHEPVPSHRAPRPYAKPWWAPL
jgi:hypothetical protein